MMGYGRTIRLVGAQGNPQLWPLGRSKGEADEAEKLTAGLTFSVVSFLSTQHPCPEVEAWPAGSKGSVCRVI